MHQMGQKHIPFPKSHKRLPTVLSPEEVARLIDSARNLYHRTLLMTLYSTANWQGWLPAGAGQRMRRIKGARHANATILATGRNLLWQESTRKSIGKNYTEECCLRKIVISCLWHWIRHTRPSSRATLACLDTPTGVAVDTKGNVYVADGYTYRVRKIWASTRDITTIAGTGAMGSTGDRGLAIFAQLNDPTGVAVDAAGNIYIAEQEGHRVRQVNPSGTISTLAGSGNPSFCGDGGAAASACRFRERNAASWCRWR